MTNEAAMERTPAGDPRRELENLRGLDEKLLLDSSEDSSTCLLIAEGGAHIRVSPSVRQLLRLVKAGFSFDQIAEGMTKKQGRPISAEELESAHQEVMAKIQTIQATNRTHPLERSFWLRTPLISQGLVHRISSRLIFAYHPWTAATLLSALALVVGIFVTRGGLQLDFEPASFWGAYGLFLLSLVAHEFGHSTACARFGAEPSDIGFTMYLIYPALYSDVTTAWRLSRWQRVVVDLGGNYFQFLAGGIFLCIYFFTGVEMLRLGFLMMLLGAAFSLNPVFKFDGYWMLSDALGVTNLGAQPRRIVSWLVRRLRRQPVEPLPWPRKVTLLLMVYTPLTFLFWGYFLWRLVPVLWGNLTTLPGILYGLLAEVLRPGNSIPGAELQQVFMSLFLLLVTYLLLARLVWPLLLKILRFRRV